MAGEVDALKLAESEYLRSARHEFDTRIEGVIASKNKKSATSVSLFGTDSWNSAEIHLCLPFL